MLTESDWTQTVDSPLDEETKLAWREWRQAMRDITDGVTVETIGEWIEIPNPPQKVNLMCGSFGNMTRLMKFKM